MTPFVQRTLSPLMSWREAIWLPLPLLGILILMLVRLDLAVPAPLAFWSERVQVMLVTSVTSLVALLAARSFVLKGSLPILCLGGGMVSIALSGAFYLAPLTGHGFCGAVIHSMGLLIGGVFQAAAALLAQARLVPVRLRPFALVLTALLVAALLGLTGALAVQAASQGLPDAAWNSSFPVRQGVVACGAALFTMAAILFGIRYGQDRNLFILWYAVGLGLAALGLMAHLLERGPDDFLSLAGRFSRLAGGLYILAGLVDVLRRNRRWDIPLDAALRESENRYNALVDLVPDAVVAVQDSRFVYCNDAALRLFGIRHAQVLRSLDPKQLVPPEEQAVIRRMFEAAWAKGGYPQYDGPLLRLDGMAVPVEARFCRIDWNGAPAVLVAVRDITERRRFEASLKESETRYRRLCDSHIVAVASGAGSRITMGNNLFLGMIGWSRREFEKVAMTWSDIRPGEEAGGPGDPVPSGFDKPVETVLLRRDGTRIPVLLVQVPIQADSDTWIALMLDLSEIQQSRDLLDKARREAEETAVELARSNRDLEQFASVSSHDLKEPLRMVTAFLSLLEERIKGCLDPQSEDYVKRVMAAATRMQELIDDLLVYSTAARQASTTAVSAAEAASLALRNLEPGLRQAGAEVVSGALPAVKASIHELTQVFQNLVSNALKFRGVKRPRVEIGAVREGAFWRFHVTDNGIGIDPAYQDRLFKIFNRLHTSDEYPGTGVGLAVCKKIVERQGGRIWVESKPGEGSTFYFTLPAVVGQEGG